MTFLCSDSFDTDTVQSAITKASDAVGHLVARWHANNLRTSGPWTSKSESPIEAVFWVWWQNIELLFQIRLECRPPFELIPQYVVQLPDAVTYRLDFAVPKHNIAIELDGHDFHERTKEQVIYRNERDRRLQSAGWTVLHYSGTELHRDPQTVIFDVYNRCLTAEGIELDPPMPQRATKHAAPREGLRSL